MGRAIEKDERVSYGQANERPKADVSTHIRPFVSSNPLVHSFPKCLHGF